ncbi:hypothetical protein D2B47_23765 [Salmonella enterica]|uniref:hypothetical protein n=1 Tax=Klebsiella pneumoniae TaxID=573 RepID=UPI001033AFD6|nr:hypothetical protein [Klebsiella pneumoniae]EBJ5156737.1 hypothetical protein [Salmonella enterica]EFM5365750.1 hypothetical protein [Escherichia coli]EBM6019477.1 hypothetical protein [Salmonella enterica]EGH5609855.1 hypothetical protein [Escherichia coli]HDC4826002.1 hypothetical protein [Escherichia coli]
MNDFSCSKRTVLKKFSNVIFWLLAILLFASGVFVFAVECGAIPDSPSPDAILYPVYSFMLANNEKVRGLIPQLSLAWFIIVLLRFFSRDIRFKKINVLCSLKAGKSSRKL